MGRGSKRLRAPKKSLGSTSGERPDGPANPTDPSQEFQGRGAMMGGAPIPGRGDNKHKELEWGRELDHLRVRRAPHSSGVPSRSSCPLVSSSSAAPGQSLASLHIHWALLLGGPPCSPSMCGLPKDRDDHPAKADRRQNLPPVQQPVFPKGPYCIQRSPQPCLQTLEPH